MNSLFRQLFACLLLLFLGSDALKATHIVGGEITYECLGPAGAGMNRYRVTLNVYRSCSQGSFGFDPTVFIGVYDAVTNQRVDTIDINLAGTDTLGTTAFDTCYTPPSGICYEHTAYVREVLLPDNANGYNLVWQRCCRNSTILNIVNPLATGQTYIGNIPNTALCNSSPYFNEEPPTFICVDDTFRFDHSATDPDGDSLVYALTVPYAGGSQAQPVPFPLPPPYQPVTWNFPYSLANILGGTPPMNINTANGELFAIPDQLGQFVFSVSVYEYRAGVLLSEVKRDFQVNVMVCPRNNPPEIIPPTGQNVIGDTLIFITGQDNCFPITVLDQNSGLGIDSVVLNGVGDMFGGGSFPGPYATLADSGLSPLTTDLCWHPLCHQAGTLHEILLPARDNWDCPEPHRVYDTLYAKVIPATPEPPEVRCVSVNDPNSITITWLNPPATRLDGFSQYELFRSDGGPWVRVATITDSLVNTYTDATVVDAYTVPYCYRLATAKDCPTYLLGPPGGEGCSIIVDASYVSQVQSLVSWNPYTVWQNPTYTLYGDTLNDFFVIDSLDSTRYLYTLCNFQGRFRVVTVDPLTGCEAWSGFSPERIHKDSVPNPIVLCRVSVEEGDASIVLDWAQIIDDDITELRILRRRDDESSWDTIYSTSVFGITTLLDDGLDNDAHSYCYVIELEDFCGNIMSSNVSCSVLLTADSEPYKSFINWTPYVGWGTSLSGYELFLDAHVGGEKLVTFTDTLTTGYIDTEITEDIPEYCYRIRAQQADTGCGLISRSNGICVQFPPTLFFPNAFTPNNDGLNDFFVHPNIFLDDFQIRIFDRWGMLIYETRDQKAYWDGYYRGKVVQEGAYVWVATGKGFNGEFIRRSGTVTVLR